MRARMAGAASSGVRLCCPCGVLELRRIALHAAGEALLGVTEQSSIDEPSLAAPHRPMRNMERLRRSMRRLMLADFDPGELLQCLQARTLPPSPTNIPVPCLSVTVSVGFATLGSSTSGRHGG